VKAGSFHAQYIALLRKAKLKERLKAARRAMQEHYPLTEQLWAEWLADEAPATPRPHMLQLFQLAVADYLSIPLWRQYLECATHCLLHHQWIATSELSAMEIRKQVIVL